jgi:hypothetical protein
MQRALFLMLVLLQATAYGMVRGVYIGVHQSYGVLESAADPVHTISGSRFGLSENRLLDREFWNNRQRSRDGEDSLVLSFLDLWVVHYQFSQDWGASLMLSSRSAPFENQYFSYETYMGSLVAKRELFNYKQWFYAYFPVGIWAAYAQATSRTPKEATIPGGGAVLGGLGGQFNFRWLMVDIAYQRLWSFYKMTHTGMVTLNLTIKLPISSRLKSAP